MRVVGVSRVLDEADVIEPFIRHHAALLDHQIVLDNGSTDGTVDILRALRDEGVSLEAYQTTSPLFLEGAYNNGLYRLALATGADWVFFLDADELLVLREAARPHDVLALAPPDFPCLRLLAFNYDRPRPEPGEHAYQVLRRRREAPEMPKIAARRFDPARISIYAGNHYAFIDGREEYGFDQSRLSIAHVPDRAGLQLARKAIIARLKPLASGEVAAASFGYHRAADFEALKRDPANWLLQTETMPTEGIDDPVRYLGGALRYTGTVDELSRLISIVTAQAELLARSHGSILDRKRLLRRELMQKGSEVRRLF